MSILGMNKIVIINPFSLVKRIFFWGELLLVPSQFFYLLRVTTSQTAYMLWARRKITFVSECRDIIHRNLWYKRKEYKWKSRPQQEKYSCPCHRKEENLQSFSRITSSRNSVPLVSNFQAPLISGSKWSNQLLTPLCESFRLISATGHQNS